MLPHLRKANKKQTLQFYKNILKEGYLGGLVGWVADS